MVASSLYASSVRNGQTCNVCSKHDWTSGRILARGPRVRLTVNRGRPPRNLGVQVSGLKKRTSDMHETSANV